MLLPLTDLLLLQPLVLANPPDPVFLREMARWGWEWRERLLLSPLSASTRRTAETRPVWWRSRSRARAGGSASCSSKSSRRPGAPWYVKLVGFPPASGVPPASRLPPSLPGAWGEPPKPVGTSPKLLQWERRRGWPVPGVSPCAGDCHASPAQLLVLQDSGRLCSDSSLAGFRATEGELCQCLRPSPRPRRPEHTGHSLLCSQDGSLWTRRTVTAAWSLAQNDSPRSARSEWAPAGPGERGGKPRGVGLCPWDPQLFVHHLEKLDFFCWGLGSEFLGLVMLGLPQSEGFPEVSGL